MAISKARNPSHLFLGESPISPSGPSQGHRPPQLHLDV